MSTKSVLITGGSGGLGGATARFLADQGWDVYAADLEGEALAAIGQHPGVTAVPMDVTDQASVDAAVERVRRSTDGLDGVVNFAGVLIVGSVIEIEPTAFQRIMDINVVGTFRVNRSFFPLVLARKGRIVNISSETGWQPVAPFAGPYGTSKHAIEAYSDALRRELVFLGVKVIKIQPGPFRTDMVSSIERNFSRAAEESTYFGAMLEKLKHLTLEEQNKAHDPQIIARAVHEALTVKRPKIAYSVKPDPQRAFLARLPEPVIDRLLEIALGKLAGR